MQVFSDSCISCRYPFVIVVDKKQSASADALCYLKLYYGRVYFFSQSFSQVAFFSQAALGQTFWQESAFSQVVQSILQESAISQVALQHESVATHSVVALSHVASLHFLLQHELMVRAATATITNNTFFIFFLLFNCLTIFDYGYKSTIFF